MQLKLRYNEHSKRPLAGAFLQGASPAGWFRELDTWKVDLNGLRCYVLPQGIHDDSGSGLFVIFGTQQPPAALVRYPYGRMTDKLYLPVQADLWPVTGADELKALLLWDIQVFHPNIGLVGFESKDEVKLTDFVHLSAPRPSDWSFAHPGLTPAPVLQQIGLKVEDEPESVMEAIKEDVGSKSLDQIPSADPDETALQKYGKQATNWLAQLGLYMLLLLALIGKIIFAPLSWFFSGAFPRSGSSGGLLHKIEQWVGQKLADIEKQRDTELKRLMDLFDKNSDEALQYAIPLSSPYLNRGSAPQSGKLTRRQTQFNLRNLGGGRRVDGWDLSNYNAQLRARYIKTANEAVEQGNFKRAAYIHAHLLGDFYTAANVLQQGKMYREAAALYRDHLKNERMAAECLEKGGLLEEAIPIYLQLNNLEKAGDLYLMIGREEKAEACYREKVTEFRQAKDYQKAAVLTLDKLKQKKEAESLLLEGWADTGQPEACLSAYLELRHDDEHGQLAQEVRQVYAQHVPRLKKTSFLTVLAEMNRRYPEAQLNETSLGIAYEIIHQQVESGDTSGLKMMSSFLPEDRLLNADTNRFIQHRLQLPPVYTKPDYIQLRNNTNWYAIMTYHDQLMAIGQQQGDLHYFRGNWEGKQTYQYLFKVGYNDSPLALLADPALSDQVLIVGEKISTHTNQQLGAYSYFEREAVLQTLDFLPEAALGCCLNVENGVSVLHFTIHGLQLSHFNRTGALLRTIDIGMMDERVNPGQNGFDPSAMVWRKGHFYYAKGEILLRISPEGQTEALSIGAQILKSTVTGPHTALKIALLTTEGSVLVTPTLKGIGVASGFFGQDIEGQDIRLMTDNRLVVAGGKRAGVFDISKENPTPEGLIDTENTIIAIVAIPKRHHCAFLEYDGRVSVYRLGDV
ncbi:hypothetical protein BDD43_1984 [Mucilaginibacter gracilis]|uniref:MoxR-vWA-beta-propeller ternary system domain-containing protein n=1 Tax=Mucilaginibacter gracilis TaxID=423350 RepID=A0A495IYP0_9SPHI|nr:hypothetical protein [Mucilaginibacter gracilis]RKR81826.1 hypothetical protein BDD43_1984 [Mucilaginibacter gracilis]